MISPARVADRHFENSGASLGKFDRELWFDIERGAFKRNAPEEVRARHLVAGFHVCEIEVADNVTQKREELISECVTEKQGALVSP